MESDTVPTLWDEPTGPPVRLLIGRSDHCNYVIDDAKVSAEHCRIDHTDGEYRLSDANSTNGTWHHGRRLLTEEVVILNGGDTIRVGDTVLVWRDGRVISQNSLVPALTENVHPDSNQKGFIVPGGQDAELELRAAPEPGRDRFADIGRVLCIRTDGGGVLAQKRVSMVLERKGLLDQLDERMQNIQQWMSRLPEREKPGLVPYGAIGLGESPPFLSLPLISGRPLCSAIDSANPQWPVEDVAALIARIAAALAGAHAAGRAHRDIRPNTILVEHDSHTFVGLISFGLTGAVRDILSQPGDGTTLETGRFYGNPHFIAPEAATGLDNDPRSDVYSIAKIALYLLTGRLPERSGAIDPSVVEGISDAHLRILRRALAVDLAHRPATAVDLAQAFSAAVAGRLRPVPRRRPERDWVTAVLGVLVLGVVLVGITHSRQPTPSSPDFKAVSEVGDEMSKTAKAVKSLKVGSHQDALALIKQLKESHAEIASLRQDQRTEVAQMGVKIDKLTAETKDLDKTLESGLESVRQLQDQAQAAARLARLKTEKKDEKVLGLSMRDAENTAKSIAQDSNAQNRSQ